MLRGALATDARASITQLALIEYRYDVPFKFTGTINKLTFNLGQKQLTAEERGTLHEALAQAHDER